MNGVSAQKMFEGANRTAPDPLRIACPLVAGVNVGYCDCPLTREMVLKTSQGCHSGSGDCLARRLFPQDAAKEYSKHF